MAEHVKIEDARTVARAAMAKPGSARRQDAPFDAKAFTFPEKIEAAETPARSVAESALVEKLISIHRVASLTGRMAKIRGRRRFGFAAIVVVGDQKGGVGFGRETAIGVQEAIRRATTAAKRHLMYVALKDGRTLLHDLNGTHGYGNVVLRSATSGTGILAKEPVRAILDALGVEDIVANSSGSTNPYDVVLATFDALRRQPLSHEGSRSDENRSASYRKAL